MSATRQLGRLASQRATAFTRTSYRRTPNVRFQSTSSSSGSTSSHAISGLAGGAVTAAALYAFYSYSSVGKAANTVTKTITNANQTFETAAKQLQEGAVPEADKAVDAVKEFVLSYAAWIPGGKVYVDKIFDKLKSVQDKHKSEVNDLIKNLYKQMQEISKGGLTMESASKAADALSEFGEGIAALSTRAAGDILEQVPEAKKHLGGVVDQLQSLSKQHGEDVEKQVSEVWSKVKDIFAGGFSDENIAKAKKLAEDKLAELQKLGDETWNKALKEAQPYLEKNPKVKELIEKNADALKSGNTKELFEKARKAVDSKNLDELQKYVKGAADKASKAASDWNVGFLQQIPQMSEVLPKLKELAELAEKRKGEGEKLLKETMEELKQVIEKRAESAKKLAREAEKDVSDAKKSK